MDDLTAEQRELSEDGSVLPQVSDQNREIKKWRAIARMVDPNPDVLPFPVSTTDPERRWAFFSQASGLLYQSVTREINETADMPDAVVAIF